jgi:maltose O-acetyltransferase
VRGRLWDHSRLRELKERVQQSVDALVARAHGGVAYRVHRARVRAYRELGHIAPSVVIYPEARIENLRAVRDALRIGEHTALRGQLLILRHGGEITIGEWSHVGASTRIWSAARVSIGDRVLIAHACEIHDWNAHPLDARARHQHFRDIMINGHPDVLEGVGSAPVVIEDDAWIGFGSTILKGVTVGRGSIVAAGSLVARSVPPGVLVAGNPARVVRELPTGSWTAAD